MVRKGSTDGMGFKLPAVSPFQKVWGRGGYGFRFAWRQTNEHRYETVGLRRRTRPVMGHATRAGPGFFGNRGALALHGGPSWSTGRGTPFRGNTRLAERPLRAVVLVGGSPYQAGEGLAGGLP